MAESLYVTIDNPKTIDSLIRNFICESWKIRGKNLYFSAHEMHLDRAAKILNEASAICDCRHRVFAPPALAHIKSLAWEISCRSTSDTISALEMNPLVLFLK